MSSNIENLFLIFKDSHIDILVPKLVRLHEPYFDLKPSFYCERNLVNVSAICKKHSCINACQFFNFHQCNYKPNLEQTLQNAIDFNLAFLSHHPSYLIIVLKFIKEL
jgi:hypothetical protein